MSAKYGTSDYQTPATTEGESANTEKVQSDNAEKEKLESREQEHPATDQAKVEDTAVAAAIPIPEVNTLFFIDYIDPYGGHMFSMDFLREQCVLHRFSVSRTVFPDTQNCSNTYVYLN